MTRAKATSELLSAFHALLRTADEAQLPDLLLEKNVRLRPWAPKARPGPNRRHATPMNRRETCARPIDRPCECTATPPLCGLRGGPAALLRPSARHAMSRTAQHCWRYRLLGLAAGLLAGRAALLARPARQGAAWAHRAPTGTPPASPGRRAPPHAEPRGELHGAARLRQLAQTARGASRHVTCRPAADGAGGARHGRGAHPRGARRLRAGGMRCMPSVARAQCS